MDKEIEYLKTTHQVYHYFKVDQIEMRWCKRWNSENEYQYVEKLNHSDGNIHSSRLGWIVLDGDDGEAYIKRFKALFGSDSC